jgi:argininosuccinate lyase
MANLWSGRFSGEPDKDVFAFGRSFPFDKRLVEDDITGSLAWAEAIHRAGVLSADEHQRIARGLSDLLARVRQDPAIVHGDDEDVHAFVERVLIDDVGEIGKRLHTGRSRNEQVSVDLRLYLKRRIPVLQATLTRLIAALVDQAARAGRTLMPAYTHLRRAQPVLVAHYWLSHVAAFRRDHARLAQVIDEADALPLGSGAIAGNSYAIDTAALAARLGFSRVVVNSMDTVADRDFVSSFLHAVALSMVHVSRLAEDVIIFGSEEFGFFDLDDRVATGSSLMPQKKNPDPLELVRGKAGRAIGRHTGWLATMKSLPSGYNKDLQEDKEAVFDAEDTLIGSLSSTATVIAMLEVKTTRVDDAAGGFMLATDVADYLVARGVPFRRAHEIVAGMVRTLIDQGRTFESLTAEDWRALDVHFEPDVVQKVTASQSVSARQTPQSTSPAAVAAALADARAWVERQSALPVGAP